MNRRMKAVLLGLVVLVSACAKQNENTIGSTSGVAPMSSEDTGYIVRATEAEVQEYAQNHGVAVRMLHQNTTYEIFDKNAESLAASFSSFFKNEYLDNLVPSRTPSFASAMASEESAQAYGVEEVKDFVKDCRRPNPFEGQRAPEAKIKMLSQQSRTQGQVTLLEYSSSDRDVELSSEQSGSPNSDSVERVWMVASPRGSAVNVMSSFKDSVAFQADMPGVFEVTLIVKDNLKFCHSTKQFVGVTYNEEFKQLGVRPRWENRLAAHVKHLPGVRADQTWQTSTGKGAVVAVIDTGVNFNHPDLNANIWRNRGEIAGDGIDNDNNGRIDDVIGWDFAMNDRLPMDDQSHGTHVSSLTASSRMGIAPDATIMPLKALNLRGGADLGSVVAAVMYAADNGAHIINASFGATHPSWRQKMQFAIDYARNKGVLFVAAAGNSSSNNDTTAVFPASLVSHDNLLAVAATKLNGNLASYSNYGKSTVHVGAPGGDRGELLVGAFYVPTKSMYVQMAGTSMAAPVTAGVAALVKARNPSLSAKQIKQVIMDSGRANDEMGKKTISGKVVDAMNAVQMATR